MATTKGEYDQLTEGDIAENAQGDVQFSTTTKSYGSAREWEHEEVSGRTTAAEVSKTVSERVIPTNRDHTRLRITQDVGSAGNQQRELLVIGLDFGTTYSGIAYAFSSMSLESDPTCITDWPGREGQGLGKVPTVMRYADDGSFSWGYEIEQTSKEKLEGIKLLLDPDQSRQTYALSLLNTTTSLRKLGKSAIDVAADYIDAIYKHAIANIEKTYPHEFIKGVQKEFVLSVPAIWSDRARDDTLTAAKRSGIHPITLIKEPEAAALYTLNRMKGRGFQVGDAFVICDAGGGTVDLISYELTSIAPFKLRELVPGDGGMAGSLILNQKFEEFIENIVGKEQFAKLKPSEAFRRGMQIFDEQAKKRFKSIEDEFPINFPKARLRDDPTHEIELDYLTLKGDILSQLFEPLVKEIGKLVKGQVKGVEHKRTRENPSDAKNVRAILLVGGFGESMYLKGSLERDHPKTEVLKAPDAWIAIVRGAVMSRLFHAPVITSSVATRHYGVAAAEIHKPEDEGEPTSVDKYEGVSRGDDLQRDRVIEFPFYRKMNVNPSPEDLIFKEYLISSDATSPPRYPKEGLTKIICTLTADFNMVPMTEFKVRTAANGRACMAIHYKLVLTISPASMSFTLDVNGKKLGRVDAKYD
ncbi:MAG: hypothetical protein M1839_004184 [Geoglossum umbratile]|nr:MAG: hypothetical protein M1839_004184 [Geoglossum umbratile]